MVKKLEAVGGSGGGTYDDGSNYNGIRKITFMLGSNEIWQIRIDYDKGGIVETQQHGENKGARAEFVVDYPTEYITSVEGTCGVTQTLVRSLTIKTSKGRTSRIFGTSTPEDNKFVLKSHGSAIIGFHGRSGAALDSIGAYLTPSPYIRLDYLGGSGGSFWDDGPIYNGIQKISFTLGNNEIRQIRVDYDKYGVVKTRAHGEDQGYKAEFVVNYPTEHIICVEGTCDIACNPALNRVRSLTFKTSQGRTSEIFGKAGAQKFVLENDGSALIGFHGRAGGALDAIGAYFSSIPPCNFRSGTD